MSAHKGRVYGRAMRSLVLLVSVLVVAGCGSSHRPNREQVTTLDRAFADVGVRGCGAPTMRADLTALLRTLDKVPLDTPVGDQVTRQALSPRTTFRRATRAIVRVLDACNRDDDLAAKLRAKLSG
jgi:hypothetical protein